MTIDRLNPETKIPGLEGITIGDFWAWAYSDILTNTTRGMFAEFLVGAALRVIEYTRPLGWEDFDLSYYNWKIEVKASAYLQSWHQEALSTIRFDIGERGSWDSDTNSWISERTRSADCYVFCLYFEQERSVANVLDTSRWEFYVLSTKQINAEFGNQKSVGLRRIQDVTQPVNFQQIRDSVELASTARKQKLAWSTI